MFNIVLYQPEIPPNTGNIIRLCVNTGAQLHLIAPLGFTMEDKLLRRAGLDYADTLQIKHHRSFLDWQQSLTSGHVFAFSTKASTLYTDAHFAPGDSLLFGPETRGLPTDIRQQYPSKQCLRLPMAANNRSMNLSNVAAIALYEALRQQQFSALN